MALLHQAQQEANASPHTSGPSFGGNGSHGHTSSSDVQGAAPTHKTSRRVFPLLFGHHRQLMETQALVEAQLWCPPQHTSTPQNGGTADKSTKRWTPFEHLPPRLCSTSSSHQFCSCHLAAFEAQVWVAWTTENKRYTGWEGATTSGSSFW